ncbi:hypothetical protein ACQKM9_08060 [Viridibacillus sp. NPDC093762]|uniref:hypothetical protein n=1 Tax=Viridibacillus sp. NPDC093762 TaxID=3390720 RepID=UPI003D01EE90
MSLTNKTIAETLQVQVKYKLHAYLGMVVYLIMLQIVGILMSLIAPSGMSSGSGFVDIDVEMYTPIVLLFLSNLWAFYVGSLMTRHDQRADIMPFITTRIMSSIGDVVVLGVLAVYAGITAMLSNYVVRIIILLKSNNHMLSDENMFNAPEVFIENLVAFIFYILCFAAVGYFLGMVAQKSKKVLFLIVAVFFSMLFTSFGQEILQGTFKIAESGLFSFMGVMIILSSICFIVATFLAGNLEVKG